MTVPFEQDGDALVWTARGETLRIEPWGNDAVRVRCTRAPRFTGKNWALLEPGCTEATINWSGEKAVLCNGGLTVKVAETGWTRFYRTDTGDVLLEEQPHMQVRDFRRKDGGLYEIQCRFRAKQGERLYGLGEHTDGLLDRKGSVVELYQRNTHVSIPFMVSNRGYGLLWNNPSVGRVELGRNRTRWVADASPEIDYVVMTGEEPSDIMARYAEVTGHPPMLPEYASGFWQCKLRYENQEELLSVAREYKKRGLPLSIIVVDWFHWPRMGEWCFDPEYWPDAEGMVAELKEMGMELMVSVWPTVNPESSSYGEMRSRGLLVGSERGLPVHKRMKDNKATGPVPLEFYDPTNPEARKYLWNKIRENYYEKGIRCFWLDCSEPAYNHRDFDHLRYYAGNGGRVSNMYPFCHSRAFHDGFEAEGETDGMLLSRGAWAGMQRFGAAVWSGDIPSTFESLREQITAGLNTAMSGIPWWTTDIGGFSGGNINDPTFRELIVRWFQYGVFCPIFRLHGVRQPKPEDGYAPNEIWSFGEEAYKHIKECLFLRERLRPYVMEQMARAHEKGVPPMRPLFVDFPHEEEIWGVEDQFMFGPDILVNPVYVEGKRQRRVYLPDGTEWTDAWQPESRLAGGQWIVADAPLSRIPVYLREESDLTLTEIP